MSKSPKEFNEWLKAAKAGDDFVYGDSLNVNGMNPYTMQAVWDAHGAGKIVLFQSRLQTSGGRVGSEYHARRVSVRALRWLNRLSKESPICRNVPYTHALDAR